MGIFKDYRILPILIFCAFSIGCGPGLLSKKNQSPIESSYLQFEDELKNEIISLQDQSNIEGQTKLFSRSGRLCDALILRGRSTVFGRAFRISETEIVGFVVDFCSQELPIVTGQFMLADGNEDSIAFNLGSISFLKRRSFLRSQIYYFKESLTDYYEEGLFWVTATSRTGEQTSIIARNEAMAFSGPEDEDSDSSSDEDSSEDENPAPEPPAPDPAPEPNPEPPAPPTPEPPAPDPTPEPPAPDPTPEPPAPDPTPEPPAPDPTPEPPAPPAPDPAPEPPGLATVPIDVVNPSFELDNAARFAPSKSIIGWNIDPTSVEPAGVFVPLLDQFNQFDEPTPDGTQLAYTQANKIDQSLTETLQPNTRYLFQVAIGNPYDVVSGLKFPGEYYVRIYAGDEVVAEGGNQIPPLGGFVQLEMEFVTGTDSMGLGHPLRIEFEPILVNNQPIVFAFDHVRFYRSE